MIFKVNAYKYSKKNEDGSWKNCSLVSNDKGIEYLTNKKDHGLHLRLEDDKQCIIFGDIDHCPNQDTANQIFNLICDEFNVKDNQISKSYCFKKDNNEKSYHWSITSLKSNFKTIKHIFKQEKYKQFTDMVDTSIYKNSWFRLPYQTTTEKILTHEIIQGNPEDFLVQNIPEASKLFEYEIKEVQKVNNSNKINNNMKTFKSGGSSDLKLLEKFVNLIDIKYCDNRSDWVKIVLAMRKVGFPFEFAETWSKRSGGYSQSGMETCWNSYTSNELITVGEGTIRYYSKQSNQEEYFKIQDYGINKKFNDYTDEGLAQIVVNEIGEDLIFQDSFLYVYYKEQWIKNNDDLCKNLFTLCIRNVLNIALNILSNKKLVSKDEEEQDKITKQISGVVQGMIEIKKVKTKNNIFQCVKILLSERLDKVEFDDMPYLMMFNNGVFNFKTKSFGCKQKEYHLTMTTGYEYTEDLEHYKVIEDLFTKVFPYEDERKLYGCLLMRSYIGINLDKYIIANGAGGNGKSVIHNLNSKTQGEYSFSFPSCVLSKAIKEGPNPEIAGGSKKRFICCEEADENLGLCNSTIKNLTGGRDGIRVRLLYSQDTKYINTCSLFNNCNEKPKLQGTVTEGEGRRILDFPFRSSFTFQDNKVNEAIHIYKGDKRFIDEEEYIKSLRNPFFNYLVNNYLDIINSDEFSFENITPETVKKRTLEYLSECDLISSWFFENYDKTNDDKDIEQCKDIFENFKGSDFYFNMNKKEKRIYTKTYFIEKLEKNMVLKHHYKTEERRKEVLEKYGKTKVNQVITGYKLKPNEMEYHDDGDQ